MTTSLSARNLPPELKQQLLDQLRRDPRLAPHYDDLVSRIGEDGVLEMALASIASSKTPPARGWLVELGGQLASACVWTTSPLVEWPTMLAAWPTMLEAYEDKKIWLPAILLVIHVVACATLLTRRANQRCHDEKVESSSFPSFDLWALIIILLLVLYYPVMVVLSLAALIHGLSG